MRTGNIMIGAVKSDTIPNNNYLTPSKKSIDSWSEKEAFQWLDRSSNEMYKAQTLNEDSYLRALSDADNSVRNYLIKKRKFGLNRKK